MIIGEANVFCTTLREYYGILESSKSKDEQETSNEIIFYHRLVDRAERAGTIEPRSPCISNIQKV
jgi:hypothetical protein